MLDKKDINYIKRLSEEELRTYIDVGFCQPKFYSRSLWLKADRVMKILCKVKLAEPFDFGKGKGKYISKIGDNSEIIKILRTIID